MKTLVSLLIVAVVGLSDVGLHAQDSQSLGAVGISRGEQQGITITRLMPGGPAQRAGLAVGDLITAINGKQVKQVTEETELASSRPAGSSLRISYVRGKQRVEVQLVLGSDQHVTGQTGTAQTGASQELRTSEDQPTASNRSVPSSTSSSIAQDSEMSPSFKKLATRAYDALQRMPQFGSAPAQGNDQRILDAQKAVDEAKYEASNRSDKHVLAVLQQDLRYRVIIAETNDIRKPQAGLSELQCSVELDSYFDADNMNEKAREEAQKKLCVK